MSNNYYRNDNCVVGGDTIVVDALAVVERLRVTHPHHFDTLVRVPATFQRIHYNRYVILFSQQKYSLLNF